jgi:hypothetical protein
MPAQRTRPSEKPKENAPGDVMNRNLYNVSGLAVLVAAAILGSAPVGIADQSSTSSRVNQVLEWNQIFIDTLIATTTPNSSSQRLGAIVHTAIFEAYNGIDRRYTPMFVHGRAPKGASPRAAVVAAAHAALVGLFPVQKDTLDTIYAASLETLRDECERGWGWRGRSDSCATRIESGVNWGMEVAQAVLDWRAADGFGSNYPAFAGGTAVGQWRPIAPATAMSAQGLAFTDPFVVESSLHFRPEPPRGLKSRTYTEDFNAVKSLGRKTESTRTDEQTALAPFWEGNATVHWNQAANQISRANQVSLAESSRLLAVLNIAMADTAITVWSGKRFYGATVPIDVTWRPATAIPLADIDGNPDTVPDPTWTPLVTTPSHPEYPAGHPSLNGAAATILLAHFRRHQTFTLTTAGQPSRTYTSITQARSDGNDARVWGGMHYPSTVEISDALGEAIAKYVNHHSMKRLRRR